MGLFEFKIDKEACFVYWVQYMAGWSRDLDRGEKEKKYCLNIIGGFSDKEEGALEELIGILKKSGEHGYFWLWNRYTGNQIEDEEERGKWKNIRSVLKDSFEKIWKIEYPKLKKWREVLSDFEIDDSMKEFVSSVENFFDSKIRTPIGVQLHFHSENNGTAGASKREFSNLIVLAISNLNVNLATKAVDTVFHELVHIIYNISSKKNLIIDALSKSEKDNTFFIENKSRWRNLIEESIIYSIAGRNFSYFTRKVGPYLYMQMSDKEKLEKFDYKGNKDNLVFQTQTVGYHIRELTNEYLEFGKEMDEEYLNKVVGKWGEYVG